MAVTDDKNKKDYIIPRHDTELVNLFQSKNLWLESDYENYNVLHAKCTPKEWNDFVEELLKQESMNWSMYYYSTCYSHPGDLVPSVFEKAFRASAGQKQLERHVCLAESCPKKDRAFYNDVLQFYQKKNSSRVVDLCWNTMCMIEQYKKPEGTPVDALQSNAPVGATSQRPRPPIFQSNYVSGLSYTAQEWAVRGINTFGTTATENEIAQRNAARAEGTIRTADINVALNNIREHFNELDATIDNLATDDPDLYF